MGAAECQPRRRLWWPLRNGSSDTCRRAGGGNVLLLESLQNAVQPPGSKTHGLLYAAPPRVTGHVHRLQKGPGGLLLVRGNTKRIRRRKPRTRGGSRVFFDRAPVVQPAALPDRVPLLR